MPTFIAGILVLYLLLVGVRKFAQLTPAAAVALVRNGVAAVVFLLAGFLLLRGNVTGAIAVAGVAASFGLIGRAGDWRRCSARPASGRGAGG